MEGKARWGEERHGTDRQESKLVSKVKNMQSDGDESVWIRGERTTDAGNDELEKEIGEDETGTRVWWLTRLILCVH